MKRSLLTLVASALTLALLGVACGDNEDTDSGKDIGSGGEAGTCDESQILCDEICTSVEIDANHCGNCGTECGAEQGCLEGKCQDFACNTGEVRCSGDCVELQSDITNCGACGNQCSGAQVCDRGVCLDNCAPGLLACDGKCIDPLTDSDYCGVSSCDEVAMGGASSGGAGGGSPGPVCSPGSLCESGRCIVSCTPGQLECGGRCVDPLNDVEFCGASDCSIEDGQGESCKEHESCSIGECRRFDPRRR